jgi:hypothetical protein
LVSLALAGAVERQRLGPAPPSVTGIVLVGYELPPGRCAC